MIYITQLVYLKPGEEFTFQRFEEIAIPAIRKYNGKLLLRVRPAPQEVIEASIEVPFEIHLVEFASESDFHDFSKDKERLKFLHLKEQAIRSTVMIKGTAL